MFRNQENYTTVFTFKFEEMLLEFVGFNSFKHKRENSFFQVKLLSNAISIETHCTHTTVRDVTVVPLLGGVRRVAPWSICITVWVSAALIEI